MSEHDGGGVGLSLTCLVLFSCVELRWFLPVFSERLLHLSIYHVITHTTCIQSLYRVDVVDLLSVRQCIHVDPRPVDQQVSK